MKVWGNPTSGCFVALHLRQEVAPAPQPSPGKPKQRVPGAAASSSNNDQAPCRLRNHHHPRNRYHRSQKTTPSRPDYTLSTKSYTALEFSRCRVCQPQLAPGPCRSSGFPMEAPLVLRILIDRFLKAARATTDTSRSSRSREDCTKLVRWTYCVRGA